MWEKKPFKVLIQVTKMVAKSPEMMLTYILKLQDYNPFSSEFEFKCKQLIDLFLCFGRQIVLQWISSHYGIPGNEQADKLVKEVSKLHPPCLLIPLRNVM
ncbi:hypothetical protein TNCV_4751021 [Trichonephila clavipes]|nr:hypothetical protein TNCV_4751021 [Trichonephila clavipes]